MQPLIKEIEKTHHELIFIHTGQHHDYNMSTIFLEELELPEPDYFLGVISKSQAIQTAKIIASCDKVLTFEKPDIVLVQGDTNSGLGAAIASVKLGISVGHIEAGCRSFDKQMPEEINRVLISHVATLHFAPTRYCRANLLRERIAPCQIFLTGHPIVDLMSRLRNRIPRNDFASEVKSYAVVTLHRRENIENREKIVSILRAFNTISYQIQLIFPCHPHTRRQITKFGLRKYLRNLEVIEPVDYFRSLSLIKHAKLVLTDSGGIQQEAALLRTPCITLREVTEWIETVRSGVNFLAGYKSYHIINAVEQVQRCYDSIKSKLYRHRNLFGKYGASERIVSTIEKIDA